MATKMTAKPTRKPRLAKPAPAGGSKAKFPRHPVGKAIRIPQAILDQNAGKACSRADAAKFLGLGSPAGPFSVEISSALKYGFLEQPAAGAPCRLVWNATNSSDGRSRGERVSWQVFQA